MTKKNLLIVADPDVEVSIPMINHIIYSMFGSDMYWNPEVKVLTGSVYNNPSSVVNMYELNINSGIPTALVYATGALYGAIRFHTLFDEDLDNFIQNLDLNDKMFNREERRFSTYNFCLDWFEPVQ